MSQALLTLITTELDQGGAQDVRSFKLPKENALADFMFVASGTSSRHVAALAERCALSLKKKCQNQRLYRRPARWQLGSG